MCFGGSSKTTTVQKVPEYIEQGGKDVLARATALADKPFEPFSGQRVADFSADQQTAFQQLRDLIAGAPQVGGEAIQGARDFAAAPAQSLSTERIVDEDGRLGAISDYMNPFVDQALQPALRKIQEQADAQRKRIGAGATSAGAFGDARHGIMEAMLGRDTSMAMGDTASQFYLDAFRDALGLRQGDLSRMTDIDKTNALFAEQGLDRLFQGSGAVLDRAGQDQQQGLQLIQSLLSSGGIQQGADQAELDAAYQEFLRQYGHDFDVVSAMASALSGLPYTRTTTTTQPNNSLMGLLGSGLGAFAGTEAGAGALAAGAQALPAVLAAI